jgi:hypothetical protein
MRPREDSLTEALGIDIGGVIIDRVHEDRAGAPARDPGYACAMPMDQAFDVIAQLRVRRFHERIWLVSRCDEALEPVLLEWLQRHDFFAVTGMADDHVHFCRQRRDKLAIARQLGLTHFIDDRLEVLGRLVGTVPHLYHFHSRAADVDRFPQIVPHVRSTRRWSDVLSELLP